MCEDNSTSLVWENVLREVLDSRNKAIDDDVIAYCAALICDDEDARESSQVMDKLSVGNSRSMTSSSFATLFTGSIRGYW